MDITISITDEQFRRLKVLARMNEERAVDAVGTIIDVVTDDLQQYIHGDSISVLVAMCEPSTESEARKHIMVVAELADREIDWTSWTVENRWSPETHAISVKLYPGDPSTEGDDPASSLPSLSSASENPA